MPDCLIVARYDGSEAHSWSVPTTGTKVKYLSSSSILSNFANNGIAPARIIALLFFELFEQLHKANAPHRATWLSGVCPFGPLSSETSFSIPPCCLTVRLARRKRATLAIVSAARHRNC